jgi:hypothetical protein
MIETRIMPVSRVVAILTLLSAQPIVRIILCVAGITVRLLLLKRPIFMAIETCGFLMFADERVVRCAVIKFSIYPFGRIVT